MTVMWKNTGRNRPDFAIEPGPGQESVWDYPRPPAIDRETAQIEVKRNGVVIASASEALVIRETASPPTWYLSPDALVEDALVKVSGSSFCEWKGEAEYFALANDPGVPIAWTYPNAAAPFDGVSGWLSFYPGRVDCFVDGERVRAQAGGFYGGWITPNVVGPFKGDPGTGHW